MFKSSENLRLAADMRALERVARPWREVRRSWFDGTPESIEARLAATERVLTYARGGVTPAHMALEREATTARAELRGASHRLMVDPLDDGARAFRGSKRVALDYDDTMSHIDRVLAEGEGHDLHTYPGLSKSDIDFDGYASDDDPNWSCSSCGEPGALPVSAYDDGPEHDPDDPDRALCPDCLDEWKDGARETRDHRRERREEHPDLYPALDDPAHYGSRRTAAGPEDAWGDDDWDDDICSDPHEEGCRESLVGGEGFDGYCGNCADRLEAQGHWGHHDASRRRAAPMASQRVALDYDMVECSKCGKEIPDDGNQVVDTSKPGSYTHDKKGGTLEDFCPDCMPKKYKRRKSAGGLMASPGEGGSAIAPVNVGGSVSATIPGAISKMLWDGSTMTGQEPSAPFNAGPGVSPKAGRRTAGGLPPSHPDNGLSDDPTQRHLDILGDDDPHYDDPYHGKQWPHDFPLPEGTSPKWNDDDTLTCPNCGYDEVELNRQGECPECDHYHADFIDDSDGDHNSFESQMERKYPILPEHGGPESGLWGGKWAPRPFESARLAAGRNGQRRTAAQSRPGHVPSHGFPITEGDEVHWIGPGTKGHPGMVKGTVLEHPAMGPNPDDIDDDGEFPYHDMALVYWGTEEDGHLDLEGVDDIVPNRHLDEYLHKLAQHGHSRFNKESRLSVRLAASGGLDWKYEGYGEDDGQSGHEATTELGDLIQTTVERPTIPNPNGRGETIDFKSPPLGWGYGIWTYEPFDVDGEPGNHRDNGRGDGDHVWQGNNGRDIYKTHDEAKAAAEKHYYSLDHHNRTRDAVDRDSGVDYGDLNKFMDEGGQGGVPGDDFDYGDIFGKESRLFARLAASGMSYEDAMAHIDEVLNAGEGHDLHHQPGVKGLEPEQGLEPEHPGYYDHSDIFDHCRACGGDGRSGQAGTPLGDDVCEGCGGTGENQGDPYGECEGCGADTQIEDLTGDPDTGLYCPDCGQACDYCGLNGGGHRHGCPER